MRPGFPAISLETFRNATVNCNFSQNDKSSDKTDKKIDLPGGHNDTTIIKYKATRLFIYLIYKQLGIGYFLFFFNSFNYDCGCIFVNQGLNSFFSIYSKEELIF